MRRLIVDEFVSLDRVAQAPGAPDEDTSGGFKHGGWNLRYMEDHLAQRWALGGIVEAGGFLLGRHEEIKRAPGLIQHALSGPVHRAKDATHCCQ